MRREPLEASGTAGMAHLTEEQAWNVFFTFKELDNKSQTAKECGVSRKCVRQVIARLGEKSDASHAPAPQARRGRPPAMSQEAGDAAFEMLTDKKTGGADSVARALRCQGIVLGRLHKTTVIRHARRAARARGQKLVVRRGAPAKGLTGATKEKRLAFARANAFRSWKSVMFTDRKKFYFRYPGSSVHMVRWEVECPAGQAEPGVYQPNKPQAVNVYAGITPFGVTSAHIVAGTSCHKSAFTNKQGKQAKNITQDEYEAVLTDTLLPEGRRIFGTHGISCWVLQQDNDPAHKVAGRVVQEWNQRHGSAVSLLHNWPPNSPDLNLIENFWARVQAKVDAKGCKNFAEFRAEVLHQLSQVPQSMIDKLYASMRGRLVSVIENEGEKIKY